MILVTYTVSLPENLPPTFRGRSYQFSYQFILGICRSVSPSGPGVTSTAGQNSSSRVMKVPIRVYNNVIGQYAQSTTLIRY